MEVCIEKKELQEPKAKYEEALAPASMTLEYVRKYSSKIKPWWATSTDTFASSMMLAFVLAPGV